MSIDAVKDAVRVKKEAMKKWETSGRQEERDIYRRANKEAKKQLARSKAHAMDEVFRELETQEGERNIYRIAKARDKSAKEFTNINQGKDEQGVVLWEHGKITERWKGYYGKLLNEDNPKTVFGDGVSNEGLIPAGNRLEVDVALKGMKHGKARVPARRNSRVGLEELRRRRSRYFVGSAPEDFRAGENARGMEGEYDCATLQREGGHP